MLKTGCRLLGAVVVGLIAACGDGADLGEQPLAGSSWEATGVAVDGTVVGMDPSTIATAMFGDGWVSGSDGCNRYRFAVAVDGEQITFDELSITGASCEVGHAEQGELFIGACPVVCVSGWVG